MFGSMHTNPGAILGAHTLVLARPLAVSRRGQQDDGKNKSSTRLYLRPFLGLISFLNSHELMARLAGSLRVTRNFSPESFPPYMSAIR